MNIQEKQLLEWLASTLKKSTDFAVSQAPDVVHQMLEWKMIESITIQSFALLLFVIANVVLIVSIKKRKDENYTDENYTDENYTDENYTDEGLSFLNIVVAAWAVVSISAIVLFCKNFDWIEILYAPKYYIIESIIHLRK